MQTLVGQLSIPVARLIIDLALPAVQGGAMAIEECWVDTGAPLSVVPFDVHNKLLWRRTGATSLWMRDTCDVGEIDIWLPTGQGGGAVGPYRSLAKFPRSVTRPRIPILLGLQFFIAHQAEMLIRPCPRDGAVTVT